MILNFKSNILFVIIFFPFTVLAQHPHQWREVRNCNELNTSADEFAPSFHSAENLLYYNSTQTGISRFYTAAVTSENHFQMPKEAAGLNARRNNRSYISFLKNGEAYLSAFKKTQRNSVLNIFKSAFKNGEWLEPQHIEEISEQEFTAHPAISADGKFMIFTSSKSGGQGGTDLWMTRRMDNGRWQEALNLGERLNSEYDEITPFIAGNDTLFFASNGFGGKGGFEIFMSVLENGEWQTPIALSGLNTAANESDFVLLKNGTALYSSDKPGGKGGLDLYVAGMSLGQALNGANEVELSIRANIEDITITTEHGDSIMIPLIPYIFFKTGSAQLPDEFVHTEKNGAFKNQPVRTEDAYYNLLNIIGERLRQFPEAKLIIEGWGIERASEERTAALSRDRVQVVVDFLKEVWNIDENRLITGFHELPRNIAQSKNENRRVELSSDDPRIFQPLKISSTQTSTFPGTFVLQLDARPRNAIKSWSISVDDERIPGIREDLLLPVEIPVALQNFQHKLNDQSLVFNFQAVDTAAESFGKNLKINIQHIAVTPALEKKREQRLLFFFLKPEDIDRDYSVIAMLEEFGAFKKNYIVKVRHGKSTESVLRANALLEKILKSNNNLIKAELEQIETLTELPGLLLPLKDYALEVSIEESF